MKLIKLNRMYQKDRELILAIAGFILIIGAYFLFKIDTKIFLGLIGTVATLYLGAIKYRIENDRLFKELFSDFNTRYDGRMSDLLNSLRRKKSYELNEEEKNLVISYLNLCSEEFLWRNRNRVPSEVWSACLSGIKENLKIPQVREMYEDEISSDNGKNSFYGLVEEIGDIK